MERMTALLVAAGSGSRAGGGVPKQYRRLAGRSVLVHAIDGLERAGIGDVRVVIGPGQESLYREAVGGRPLPAPIFGGAGRQDSVRNGLEAMAADGAPEAVFIHDCARPFLPAAVVAGLREGLAGAEGAVPVLPVVDTLARADSELGDPVSRDGLVRVQTPQAFRFEAILAAHRNWSGAAATDDAQVARAAGLRVAAVAGDEALEKLTNEEDFERAEARLARTMTTRMALASTSTPSPPARIFGWAESGSRMSADSRVIATPTCFSTLSPTLCLERSAPATLATISRRATRNGAAPLPRCSSSMPGP